MKIIISPFSKALRFDIKTPNPKNYPHWKEVVQLLRQQGHHVIQVGLNEEADIGDTERKNNLSLSQLKELLMECDTWCSIDNFFNHFASYYGKRGVVIFGKSDERIYGYPENINLLKDRKYLRWDQFFWWEQTEYNAQVFVDANIVVDAINSVANVN